MALSISTQVGPLAQIGINLLSWELAYNLTTGAYGWLKGNERTKALTEVISAAGGSLVSTTSFNMKTYVDVRQHHHIQAVVVQERRVQTASLPRASSALSTDPGIANLRALTSALLCFYDPQDTTSILSKSIVGTLIIPQQEGTVIEFEGPLLASLQQSVEGVAKEEDSDTFRKYLLGEHDKRIERLFCGKDAAEILSCDHRGLFRLEIHLIIGALRWILTPAHRRDTMPYPTRSLHVWSVSTLLYVAGFQVTTSLETLSSTQAYDAFIHDTGGHRHYPEVVLVTTSGCATDQMAINASVDRLFGLRPRMIAMRGIPWEAFRAARGNKAGSDTIRMADIWEYAYKHARECMRTPESRGRFIYAEIKDSVDNEVHGEFHRSLLISFGGGDLRNICGKAMKAWIPDSPSPDWNIETVATETTRLHTEEGQTAKLEDIDLHPNTLKVMAVMLGTIYGMISRTCLDNGKEIGLASDVIFYPDIIYRFTRFTSWCRVVGAVLSEDNITPEKWTCVILDMMTAVDTNAFEFKGTKGPGISEQRFAFTLGAQANGMVAIREIAVNPTISRNSNLLIHVHRGQIINLPYSGAGYIEASDNVVRSTALPAEAESDLSTLPHNENLIPDTATRVDTEPDWEADPRKVVYRIRRDGVTIADVNISMAISYILEKRVDCQCKRPSLSIQYLIEGGWQYIPAEKLIESTRFMIRSKYERYGKNSKYLVDGQRSEALSLYCLGMTKDRNVVVADKCFLCATKKAAEIKGHAMIILVAETGV